MNEAVSTPSRRLPPDDVLAASKAQLIAALAETLKSRGLTQVRAAQLCGTDQPSGRSRMRRASSSSCCT
ncbi:MAG: XRE family transcriptional regulator [Microvirga sp.]